MSWRLFDFGEKKTRGVFDFGESATTIFTRSRPDEEDSLQGKRKIMASICLFSSKTLVLPSAAYLPVSSSSTSHSFCVRGCRCSFPNRPIANSNLIIGRRRTGRLVVRMAPEEEKLTRRNPLDFPIVTFSLSFISLRV